VEECESQPAKICPRCSRRAKFLYRLPSAFVRHWACRRCHNLGYFAETRGRSAAAALAADDENFAALEDAFFDGLRDYLQNSFGLPSPEFRRQQATLTRALRIRLLDQKRARRQASLVASPEAAPVADEPETLVLEELPENYFEQIRDWARASAGR
jgi:hypothetical protein